MKNRQRLQRLVRRQLRQAPPFGYIDSTGACPGPRGPPGIDWSQAHVRIGLELPLEDDPVERAIPEVRAFIPVIPHPPCVEGR